MRAKREAKKILDYTMRAKREANNFLDYLREPSG